jgi:hypothetical protein
MILGNITKFCQHISVLKIAVFGLSRRLVWYTFTDLSEALSAAIIRAVRISRPKNLFEEWELVESV